MNIYVGNLPFSSTEEDVRQAFEEYGEVSAVRLISDRETGRPRGFGFVEMPSDDEANTAIAAMNGKVINGRPLKVNEARPKEDRGGPRRHGRF
jgi:RNA recognition motif-containing protein